jgi:hypothetical protein
MDTAGAQMHSSQTLPAGGASGSHGSLAVQGHSQQNPSQQSPSTPSNRPVSWQSFGGAVSFGGVSPVPRDSPQSPSNPGSRPPPLQPSNPGSRSPPLQPSNPSSRSQDETPRPLNPATRPTNYTWSPSSHQPNPDFTSQTNGIEFKHYWGGTPVLNRSSFAPDMSGLPYV